MSLADQPEYTTAPYAPPGFSRFAGIQSWQGITRFPKIQAARHIAIVSPGPSLPQVISADYDDYIAINRCRATYRPRLVVHRGY